MSGTIFLDTIALSIGEAEGQALVPVARTGDLSQPVTIEYGITGLDASDGNDFIATTGTVTLLAGQSQGVIPVTILNDNLSENTETVVVSLINVDSGFLEAPRTARVSILDDENPITDPPVPPLQSDYDVNEVGVVTGLSQPIDLEFAPNSLQPNANSGIAYVAEKGGRIVVVDTATGQNLSEFIDISDQVNNRQDRGLLDIALDPNFPDNPFVYAFYVVDPPESQGLSGNAGPNGGGNRYAHVVRFEADAATNFQTAVPGSETVLVGGAAQSLFDISGAGAVDSTSNFSQPESGVDPNTGDYIDDYIKVDSRSHAGGALAFGPDGALYISIGDGTSFNAVDARSASVQEVGSLSGKVLRVDPATGLGLADNPFATPGIDLSSNEARVYQSGFRNPFSMSFDDSGRLFVTDTGWNSYEELNSGPAGANFGWPWYEGADTGVLRPTPGYQNLSEAQAFYDAVDNGVITVSSPYRGFSHNNNDPGFQFNAITGGDVDYDGSQYPAIFNNDYFFTDFSQGEVFAVDLNDRTELKYLYTTDNGRGPVHFTQGPDGFVYVVDIVAGRIERLTIEGGPDSNEAPVASDDATTTTPDAQSQIINVLSNDIDPDGDQGGLSVVSVNGDAGAVGNGVEGSNGGFFSIAANGIATFDPAGAFNGLAPGTTATTSIDYVVTDAAGGLDTATYTASVTAPGGGNGSIIEIEARGDDGRETFDLQIDGQTVASFNNIPTGGQTYTYQAADTVTADQVRVVFTTDVYDPANGIDYNLIVDRISIDGEVFETEDPSVFSTGTWLPGDGIAPGFGRGDVLNGLGFFQYADDGPGGDETTIEITAAGRTGNENMDLIIDGAVVASYFDVATGGDTFQFVADGPIEASQVRVAFTNDIYDPANGIDYDLIVDKIEIDGQAFESESATTFSTGTWTSQDGIVPGFGRGDVLNGLGYFEYDQDPANPPTPDAIG